MISTLKAHSRNPLCRTPTTHGQLVSELDTSVEENEGMLKRMKSQILFCACVWTATATAMCTSHSNCAYCSGQCSAMSGTCWNAAGDVLSQSPYFPFAPPPHPLTVCVGMHRRGSSRSCTRSLSVVVFRRIFFALCCGECLRVGVCASERQRACVCVYERERVLYSVGKRVCVYECV